ncbi:hypothetical protein V5738_05800 [Salinisphaera sp. SPP-AMP-43]|uniref:hypothetical protein n=1 Tax=Salinisphaera sp. SPP-AMP-43 TaxID=3121288 RepID=UPI003C6E34BC
MKQIKRLTSDHDLPGQGGKLIGCLLAVMLLLVGGVFAKPARAAPDQPLMNIRLAHLDADCAGSAPVTFGQPFRPGDVPRGRTIKVQNGDQTLPGQVDVKARNADGSVRHAIVSLDVPCSIDRDDALTIAVGREESGTSGAEIADVLNTDFDSRIAIDAAGHAWQASARDLLRQIQSDGGCAATKLYCRRWLKGRLANEWVVGAPLADKQGQPHPRLMAFFAVRAYGKGAAIGPVRVDVTVENDWSYDVAPANESYEATLSVPGQKPIQLSKMTHYAHARWHQVLWWQREDGPAWFAALNGKYLQATPAVPNYQSIDLSPSLLAHVRQSCAPMDHCDVMGHMESTGAQPQIGPLPQWSSAYAVNTRDYRVYRWMLANSDALGAYGIHYREKATGEPLSLDRHPCATLLGPAEQSKCHVPPHGDDRLPDCAGDCHSPIRAESAHHGAPAYMAYLVTGDWFYAQELSAWANWVVFSQNPGYRDYRAGLIHDKQLRGQAWALRTLGYAAYALPDDAPIKSYFISAVENNIRWYNSRYTDNSDANPLGFVKNGYALAYPFGDADKTGIAPWQMSFFTWATGNLADLGFDGADRMRNYFSRFQIGALTSSDFCSVMASAYKLRVRDSQKSSFYTDFGTVYDKSFSDLADVGCEPKALSRALKNKKGYDGFSYPPGTMVGYPKSDTGFVANYQIGMAAAANSDLSGASKAWDWFMDRPVRPDYTQSPQFAVTPSE